MFFCQVTNKLVTIFLHFSPNPLLLSYCLSFSEFLSFSLCYHYEFTLYENLFSSTILRKKNDVSKNCIKGWKKEKFSIRIFCPHTSLWRSVDLWVDFASAVAVCSWGIWSTNSYMVQWQLSLPNRTYKYDPNSRSIDKYRINCTTNGTLWKIW